ncbi:AAA family ATPase [Allokutzneria sp. A3M-2-11 16]|uniref:ATP-dependent nuclease n=1 Tax=Allokutzneria sp. A3M-2-11 16 TaxID=2962043 RepID=UPI0020B71A05|nr:AAA family ATPase [Allokutzneria sp. A3M-2-11 16]MCP3800716.1 AAA family ATPase [Allokutzneria sp. A3M-2-11 16]
MRIDRLVVKNFRNLADVDLRLEPGSVVVGENGVGKSNLLHAIRLVLDPSLSSQERNLSRDDFWDGLSDSTVNWDPMAAEEVIMISVELVEFEDQHALVAVLGDALVPGDPMRARLTYLFAPRDTGSLDPGATVSYQAQLFGGENADKPLHPDLRGYLCLVFLPALRDVETDLNNYRRSPLRTLLEAAASAVPTSELDAVRQAMKDANEKVNDLGEIKQVAVNISKRIADIVGANQALETELAVAADDPLRLIRNMKLFVDGPAHRRLGTTSLGTLNVLYLALLELGLEHKLRTADIAHVVMAIEEPEAHLHPHMQRSVFRRLLNPDDTDRTTLVTTQSPHIASVAAPRSLVVLREVDGQTTAASAHEAELTDAEWDDIARYLDATRAELVFARRVLLVEGYAEQVLLPALARTRGLDLDKAGVTVCAIHGTHFTTYARFCEALKIPWAVVTDADLTDHGVSEGVRRAEKLLAVIRKTGPREQHGIFVGTTTFEYDLLTAGGDNVNHCFATLTELKQTMHHHDLVQAWGSTAPDLTAFMDRIDAVGGKGRFAQRLALRDLRAPGYIARALDYLGRQ